jgi:heme/copper-type cytochrome/quinol oxidase subunit 4
MDMDVKEKLSILPWVLRIAALVQAGYWGASHLFFPQWYLRSMGLIALAADPGPVLIFLHEIGILTIGLALATWLAARDPLKNFAIIVTLCFVAIGSIAVSIYHILIKQTAQGEWITVAVIFVQLLVVALLYPWRLAIGKQLHS